MIKNDLLFIDVFTASRPVKFGVPAGELYLKPALIRGKLVVDFELTIFTTPIFIVPWVTITIKGSGLANGSLTILTQQISTNCFELVARSAAVTECGGLEKPETLPKPPSVSGGLQLDFGR